MARDDDHDHDESSMPEQYAEPDDDEPEYWASGSEDYPAVPRIIDGPRGPARQMITISPRGQEDVAGEEMPQFA